MPAASASLCTVCTSQYCVVPSEPSISCAPTDHLAMVLDSSTIMARLVAISSRTRFMAIYSPLRRSKGGRLYGIQDGARALLGDDIGRRVGIPGRDAGEYRSIDHAQAPDAVHAQLIVDHRHRIAAHLAGSHRVEDR